MRDILFRGKRIDNGEWVCGDLIWADYIPARAWISSPDDGNRLRRIDTGSKTAEWRGIEVDPDTVGQYTGLTDKNGHRIFEGDIIKFTDEKKYIVTFFTDASAFGFEDDYSGFLFARHNSNICKVVGNIHDNPELMEVGE